MPRKAQSVQVHSLASPIPEQPTLAETLAALEAKNKSAQDKYKLSREADEAYRKEQKDIEALQTQVEVLKNDALLGVLTPEVINALAPTHARPCCSDEDPRSLDVGCARCGLVRAARDGYVDFKFTFSIESF